MEFIKAGIEVGSRVLSENGANKFSQTEDPFVTQFGLLGSYKVKRPLDDIRRDHSTLWSIDKHKALLFTFYLRIINRKVNYYNKKTKDAQMGAELRHESIQRYLLIKETDPETFYKNLNIFVCIGSWKDIFDMMRLKNEIDHRLCMFVVAGLTSSDSNLVKKYIPYATTGTTQHKKINTQICHVLCKILFGVNKSVQKAGAVAPIGMDGPSGHPWVLETFLRKYRKLKVSGTAHTFQQLISKGKFQDLIFDNISGRALFKLVHSKFMKNHDLLQKYKIWISGKEKVKYTGFVHELFQQVSPDTEETINKQFETLLQNTKVDTNFIVVRDISGSMASIAAGTNSSCFNIAKSLALFFSYFLKNDFKDHFITFSATATMHKWNGDTPVQRWKNDTLSFVGNTNFQSVIGLLVSIKKMGIKEENFPGGILCISDGEFDPTTLYETNVETAKRVMLEHFSHDFVEKFKIVLWNLHATQGKFETHKMAKNVFYFSGYSAATIKFLCHAESQEEIMDAALSQEILKLVEL